MSDKEKPAPKDAPGASQKAPEAQKTRRGMKYIGDGVEHYSGVPMRDLTWEETRVFFGESLKARRSIVERKGAIYAWEPPKEAGEPPEDDE